MAPWPDALAFAGCALSAGLQVEAIGFDFSAIFDGEATVTNDVHPADGQHYETITTQEVSEQRKSGSLWNWATMCNLPQIASVPPVSFA